jgi:uncharacterized protein YkvS
MLVSSLRSGDLMVQTGLTLDLDVRTMNLAIIGSMVEYSDGLYFLWFKNNGLITLVQPSAASC